MIHKSDFKKVRDIVFLKDVFLLTMSSIGGPEMHMALFQKKLVIEKKYISQDDLLELNSLCQILPGPTSTQTLTSIAFKIGGPKLAFLSLLIWILPAALLMTFFAISVSTNLINISYLRYVGPMAVGFVFVAAYNMMKMLPSDLLSVFLATLACIISIVAHSPVAFPVLLIFGGFMSVQFGNRKFVPNNKPILNVKWANFTLFLSILIGAAVVGAITRHSFPSISEPVRLFENTYRMGSMVFGGGNVLYSMILTEFVEFRQKQYLTIEQFNTGLGLLQAVPGPTFTLATYANGIAMKKMGYDVWGQMLGCGVGTIAVFLPGTLLIFFVYPIWNQLKQYPIINRSLDGIIAVAIGLVWAAALSMLGPVFKTNTEDIVTNLAVLCLTVVCLLLTRVPSFVIVVLTILAGIVI